MKKLNPSINRNLYTKMLLNCFSEPPPPDPDPRCASVVNKSCLCCVYVVLSQRLGGLHTYFAYLGRDGKKYIKICQARGEGGQYTLFRAMIFLYFFRMETFIR